MSSLSKTTKGDALKGLSIDVIGTALVMIANLALTPLILSEASAEIFGYWLTISSIIAYLGITDIGISSAVIKRISGYTGSNLNTHVQETFNAAFTLSFLITGVFFVIVIILGCLLRNTLTLDLQEINLVRTMYILNGLSGALGISVGVLRATSLGLQKVQKTNTIDFYANLIGIVATILLLKLFNQGVLSLAYGLIIRVFALTVLNVFNVKIYLISYKWKINLKTFKELASFGGYFQLGRIANTVALNVDNVVITSFLGAALVSPFNFSSKLTIIFTVTIASKFGASFFPFMSKLFSNDNVNNEFIVRRLLFLSMRISLLTGFLIILVNRLFVKLWVGDEFLLTKSITFLIISAGCIDMFYRLTSFLIYASGNVKIWSLTSLLEAFSNVLISIFLVKKIGLSGVVYGTLVSRSLSVLVLLLYWLPFTLSNARGNLIYDLCNVLVRSLPSFFLVSYFYRYSYGYSVPMIASFVILVFMVNIVCFEWYSFSKRDQRMRFVDFVYNLITLKSSY